jgi:hypothetical protein
MRLIRLGGLFLGFAPGLAVASPLVTWGTTDLGIYATATNTESSTYNCTGAYTLTINGVTTEEHVFFSVGPNFSGSVAYARTINLPPSQWRFSGGEIRCN